MMFFLSLSSIFFVCLLKVFVYVLSKGKKQKRGTSFLFVFLLSNVSFVLIVFSMFLLLLFFFFLGGGA